MIKLFEPLLKKTLQFEMFSSGFVHFICVPKSYQEKSNSESNESNLNEIDIFYTDNRGIVKKIKNNSTEELNKNETDTDLSDTMWQNRKLMTKNLPESNLAKIIDTNKSNKLINKNDQFIDEINSKNIHLDLNIRQIESTPAYLMPKVGSFCFDTLKSMLFKLDENKYESLNAL